MVFNWLDIVLLLILVTALILGIIKGLVRQVVGILAVIVGLILALAFYSGFAGAFKTLIKDQTVAGFLGFISIFLFVLTAGWLIGRMFSKVIKGPLKFLNHLMGGALGLLKGALICGILVFAMLVFPVNSDALRNSLLAPPCVEVTGGLIDLIPEELKEAFSTAYEDIFGEEGGDVTRI
jgi:membrane protein required for colicin V production